MLAICAPSWIGSVLSTSTIEAHPRDGRVPYASSATNCPAKLRPDRPAITFNRSIDEQNRQPIKNMNPVSASRVNISSQNLQLKFPGASCRPPGSGLSLRRGYKVLGTHPGEFADLFDQSSTGSKKGYIMTIQRFHPFGMTT
jgi:hypothetical protein